jgi:hypothetical protein
MLPKPHRLVEMPTVPNAKLYLGSSDLAAAQAEGAEASPSTTTALGLVSTNCAMASRGSPRDGKGA